MSSSQTGIFATSSTTTQQWPVLLVEDEPVQCMLVARILRRAGYRVYTAADGREALQILAEQDIRMVVTDWEMPGMDGIALCRELRAHPRDGYQYIIMLTARNSVEHVVTGLRSGADDYLVKPIVEPELLARLSTAKRLLVMEQSLREANAENRRLSQIDSLTGVYNRRYLMEHLHRELERAQRYGHALSLLLCDIDRFKSINDTYGHQAGDFVLVEFAQRLRKSLRDTDWIARYGGEEFVVVLPETSVENAGKVAERCRQSLMQEPCVNDDFSLQVTASFGVTGWEPGMPDETLTEKLIASADAGMYTSKSEGRNRVTVVGAQRAA